MPLPLNRHPQSPVSAVDAVWVSYSWGQAGQLCIRYYATGTIACVSLPPKAQSGRSDGLWEDTCFELFLREPSAKGYCEFNFSPSGRWAAYRFSDYRKGVANLELPSQPSIIFESSATEITMEVTLDLPDMARPSFFDAAFTAVIADKHGAKSYWALSHPQAKPDFHHEQGFTHQLKAANNL